jgi:hypothetical protein
VTAPLARPNSATGSISAATTTDMRAGEPVVISTNHGSTT